MRTMAMTLSLLLCSAALTSGCAHTSPSGSPTSSPTDAKASLLINVTHGKSDLHSASMGLGLAKAALDHDRHVVVFLNVEAAAFADRDLGTDVKFADFPPIAELLKDILAKLGNGGKSANLTSVPRSRSANAAASTLRKTTT